MTKKTNQSGFTLLEIMLVVTIIALLLGTAIYKLRGNVEMSRIVAVQSSIQSIKTQLRSYESLNGFMPTTEQGLKALVSQPSTERGRPAGRSSSTACPKDPWGTEFVYVNPGRKNPTGYDLYSAGQEPQARHADDEWGG
jgi:general secretion pathway protein G